jgi:hypothetical protein
LLSQWVTGFSEGLATFVLDMTKNSTLRSGWQIQPAFQIEVHRKDILILQSIQKYFSVLEKELNFVNCEVGRILSTGDKARFRLSSIK